MQITRVRKPYTREELESSYDEDIKMAIEHLNDKDPYVLCLKTEKIRNMKDFDNRKVVLVFKRDWFGTEQCFYSDGTMHCVYSNQ